jgi:hypothetical protein
MAPRIRLPREDHRRWGQPVIWVILVAIVIILCLGCSDIPKWFGLSG